MLTLVLVVFALANLGLKLGADVVEQLVQARRAVPSGRDTSHASMRIHGHDCDASAVILLLTVFVAAAVPGIDAIAKIKLDDALRCRVLLVEISAGRATRAELGQRWLRCF